jgi:ribonuclease J
VTPNEARIVAKVPHGRIFVDGKGIGDVEEVVIRDRKYLSEDGVVIVIMSVDRETGDVLEGPIIHSRGFVDEENNAKLLHEAANVVLETYQQMNNEAKEEGAVVQATIKKALRAFIKGRLDRFPVILVMVMEV